MNSHDVMLIVLFLLATGLSVVAVVVAAIALARLDRIRRRLGTLELLLPPPPDSRPARPASAPKPAPEAPAAPLETEAFEEPAVHAAPAVPAATEEQPEPAAPSEPVPAGPPASVEASPAPHAPQVRPSRTDFESLVGARWTTWIGALALIFAAAFFLKWSFEQGLLGPAMRVALGLASGLGMMLAGAVLRRRGAPILAQGLAGGGLGILYLSFFAAHQLYDLMGPRPAFAAMIGVSVLGALAALRMNSLPTAMLAVLGALLTPALIRTPEPNETALEAYLLVLALGVLLVAAWKEWPALHRVAWAGTAAWVGAMVLDHPAGAEPWARLTLLTLLFLAYAFAPLARALVRGAPPSRLDFVLVVANPLAYVSAALVTLEHVRPELQGFWVLGVALIEFALAMLYAERVPEDRAGAGLHVAVALSALALFFPLTFDGPWVTLGWGAQALTVLWFASRAPGAAPLLVGLALAVLAVFRICVWDPADAQAWPFLNVRFVVHALVAGGFFAAGFLLAPRRDAPGGARDTWADAVSQVLWIVGTLAWTVLLWREPPWMWPGLLLAVWALGLARIGRERPEGFWAGAAALIAMAAFARTFFADAARAEDAAQRLLNVPLLIRLGIAGAFGLGADLLSRARARAARPAAGTLAFLAGLTGFLALTFAWTDYHRKLMAELADAAAEGGGSRYASTRALSFRMQVGLSVIWSVYAAGLLGMGFAWGRRVLRITGLIVLGVVVVKVFTLDMADVSTAYRIVSFLVLGLVLLAVAYLYQKKARRA